MTEKAGELIYNIFKTVIQDEQYYNVASAYREKLDALQALISTFSKTQWQAIDEYLDASLTLHHTMMEIALKISYPDSD